MINDRTWQEVKMHKRLMATQPFSGTEKAVVGVILIVLLVSVIRCLPPNEPPPHDPLLPPQGNPTKGR